MPVNQLPNLLFSLILALLWLPAFSFADETEDSIGQYCLINKSWKVAAALANNTSIGIKVRTPSGELFISGAHGQPYQLRWHAQKICLPAQRGVLELYKKSWGTEWSFLQTFNTRWLAGVDLEFHRAGSFTKRLGVNLRYRKANDPVEKSVPAYWLSTVIREKPELRFHQICLPGTNGSGSYALNSDQPVPASLSDPHARIWDRLQSASHIPGKLKKTAFIKWMKTQNKNVLEQLEKGIRYLSFSVSLVTDPNGQPQVVSSNGLPGAKLQDILSQVSVFLSQNPNEFIVLSVRDGESPQVAVLTEQTIENELNTELLLPADLGLDFVLSKQLKQPGRVMVIKDSNIGNKPWIWSSSQTLLPLKAEGRDSVTLQRNIAQATDKAEGTGLIVLPLTLRPLATDIYFLPGVSVNTQRKLADMLRWPDGIALYTANALRGKGHSANVLLQDFATREPHQTYRLCMNEMRRQAPAITTKNPTPERSPLPTPRPPSEEELRNTDPVIPDILNEQQIPAEKETPQDPEQELPEETDDTPEQSQPETDDSDSESPADDQEIPDASEDQDEGESSFP